MIKWRIKGYDSTTFEKIGDIPELDRGGQS